MEDKKVISVKNYYILAILLIMTVGIVFYLVNWYQTGQENKPTFSVVGDVVSEVKPEELSNYLLDNPNIVIYFASSKDKSNVNFEKEFKKYLLNEEIHNEFIYLDTTMVDDNSFYKNFADKYYNQDLKNKNVALEYFPNMVLVKEGKVTDVLIKNNSTIKINDVEDFLTKNEVVIR